MAELKFDRTPEERGQAALRVLGRIKSNREKQKVVNQIPNPPKVPKQSEARKALKALQPAAAAGSSSSQDERLFEKVDDEGNRAFYNASSNGDLRKVIADNNATYFFEGTKPNERIFRAEHKENGVSQTDFYGEINGKWRVVSSETPLGRFFFTGASELEPEYMLKGELKYTFTTNQTDGKQKVKTIENTETGVTYFYDTTGAESESDKQPFRVQTRDGGDELRLEGRAFPIADSKDLDEFLAQIKTF